MAAGGTTPLPDAPTKGAWSTDKLLPLTRLRTLDVDADLAFGQLTLSKLPIQNAALKASGVDGQRAQAREWQQLVGAPRAFG